MQTTILESHAAVLLFPEHLVTHWNESTDAFWGNTLTAVAAQHRTILIGAWINQPATPRNPFAQNRYLNVLLARGEENAALYEERIPIPIAMWKPFGNDGVPMNFFRPRNNPHPQSKRCRAHLLRTSPRVAVSFFRSRTSDDPLDQLERLIGEEHAHSGDSAIQRRELGSAFPCPRLSGHQFLMSLARSFPQRSSLRQHDLLCANTHPEPQHQDFGQPPFERSRNPARRTSPSAPSKPSPTRNRRFTPTHSALTVPTNSPGVRDGNRGTITLERQPASLEEAVAWTKWLLGQGIHR